MRYTHTGSIAQKHVNNCAYFRDIVLLRSPTKMLMMTTVLVSLSRMYSSTTKDWNTLKNTERTDRPSRDFRLLQNWTSGRERKAGQQFP